MSDEAPNATEHDTPHSVDGSSPGGSSLGGRGPQPQPHAAASVGDELPAELDVTKARPWKVPGTDKRRIAAWCYFVVAVGCGAGFAWTGNEGMMAAGVFLAAVGAHHRLTAWPHRLDETAALAASAGAVGFAVGHASAQLAWRGLRSRPTWRVLLYSADEPPSKRGLVEIDAVDGEVIGQYTEDNPEDWSAYGYSSTSD